MSFSRFTAILRCGLFLFPLIVLSAPVQSASYNGIWTFDENSGTTANDTSGKNNHGSFNGSPSWGTGISGSGLSFSGGSDRVLVSDSPSLDFASGITLAAWIKPSQLATQYVIKKATSNTTDGYELGLSSSGVVFVRFNQPSSGNTYRLNSLSNYPTDSSTWMHVVATYDGAEIKLYINGALESTKAATLSIAKNNLSLAFGAQHDGLYPYAGMLDEIHVGPTALTALEVADLYASATATPTINILGLQQYGMQRSTDLLVQTSVSNVQASWGVRFNLISGAYTQEIQDYTAPFEHSFTALPQGDYRIEATLIDGVGVDVVSSNGKAVIDPYGIGEIYIAVGDSIIYGSNDDLSSDNISQDQRNTGGGFLPVLNDLLAQFRGYPNLFINEGVGGTNSADGITITSSALSNTPNAGYVIVGFGSNDRFGGRASGLGLSPGNGGYNNSYKDNMQQIVDMIFAAGKIPALGKIAIVYANCTSCSSFDDAQVEATNALIREYNQVVDELLAANPAIIAGPDFYALFKDNPQLISADGIHPTGVGYQRMAREWLKVLEPSVDADGDGYLVSEDAFPADPTEWRDNEPDGIGDNADTDDDNDGMPDAWELLYGFNPLDASDAAGDADGDGISNLNEFLGGTEPKAKPAAGYWKLDETSGATASDSSQYLNHGTLQGTQNWGAGIVGQSLTMASGSDRILVADSDSLDASTQISLSAWVKPSSLASQNIIKKGRKGSLDGYEIGLSGGSGVPFFRINQASSGNTYRVDATTNYPTDGATWVHVSGTYDGSDLKIYVNGILENQLAAPGLIIGQNDAPLSIGAQDNGTSAYAGGIDEVYVHTYALTATEVKAISYDLLQDDDGDGVANAYDLFPSDPTEWADNDKDGLGDNADPDDDNDGMPDTWEIFYSFDPLSSANATGDADLDGTNNLAEFLAGTHPKLVRVAPTVETPAVISSGDAADDPAIWIHPQDNTKSRVIGTDKQSGVYVYDLSGNEIQYVPTGRINNIDVRYEFPFNGGLIDIVVGSNRTTDSIVVYKIDPVDGTLINITANSAISTVMTDTYGFCLYRSPTSGKTYAFINSYFGNLEQWELTDNGANAVAGTLVRSFSVGSRTEGCVADDEHSAFYISEELVGIWKYGAEPDTGTTRTLIDKIGSGGHLVQEVEGLAIYHDGDNAGYLIASSQWSNDYVIYNREGNNEFVGRFEIIGGNGIDAVSNTDGIEVTNVALNGMFSKGMFVAQDFNNTGENQNFKMVPWESIATSFQTPLAQNISWKPRKIVSGTLEAGTWTLDDNAGLVATDTSVNGNHGSLNGAPVWVPGVSGSALSFNGGSDRVLVSDAPSLDVSSAMSVSVWIRPNRVGTQYVLKKARPNSIDGFEISLSGSGGVPFVRFNQASNGNNYRLNASSAYPTDGQTWMHIATTFDGSTIRLYINGVEEASLSAPGLIINQNNLALAIGAQDDGTYPFYGEIDDVHLFDRAISQSEVTALSTLGQEPDADGDGVPDSLDAFPFDPLEWADNDRDGIGDNADPDDDNDGMPDVWEIQYGFDPLNAADAALDADGDGVSNLDEYLAGTVPIAETSSGRWSMDENSGSVVNDSSGNANHGALNGAPTWVPGVSGSALSFNGGSDRVLVADAPALDVSTAMSMAVWIRPNRVATQYVMKKARANTTDGFELGLSGSGLVPFVRFNQASSGNTYRVDASSTYPTDGQTWMHIAVTFDGSDIRLYINGVEEGILNAPGLSINQNNLALSFGAQDDGTYPFFGEIDEVYLYNYAITPAEILALSTAGQEPDTDGDGVPDSLDAFPLDPLEWADNDNDGIGDNADTDDDNDGMPDLWEIQYGFDPLNAADAALDADGDGVSNLDEYLAGTVPVSQTPVGSWNLDENSGLVANDSSPHGNHGSLNGSPIWVTGVRGSALSLGGGNDRVLINDDPTLDVSSQMSLSVWIRPTQIYTQYILKKARANTNDGFELGLSGNGRVPFIRFNQSSSGNSYRVDATSLYPTDGQTWMHIAATYDGNTIRLYIDGIEEGSLSAPGLIIGQNNLPLSIGAQDDGLYPFTGAIDEVHVYDFAITASDVLALSNADQVVDTDGDGVPDDLDAFPLDPLEWADNDGDGIGDNADTDDDNDGMPDEWEIQYGFDPLNAADALLDADGDGVSNLDEYLGGTNPLPVDTDGDGVPDSQDAFPLDPLEWADNDGDGIGDNADPDDDNDLMPDVWEIQYGMNPFDPTDAALDYDGDGFTNLEEYLAGTNPLPQSQVGLWTLDDNGGSVAIDGSPNGNHGTINGAPSWVPGISGSALSFGGGADRVVVADAPSLDVSTAMSLAVWIRPTQVYTQYVIKKARPNATDGFELSLSSGGIPFIRFNQASSGNSYRVDGTTPYPSDGQTWMHIAATFDGSVIRLFVNGVEEGSLSAPGMVIGQNNLPFSIGAQDDGAFPFTGTLDEVYLYDYAITASDVIGLVSAAPGSDTLLAYQKDTLSTITATADVGEKPQSKVWQFDNYFWMVLPDDTGTWVWRLDGTSWTKVYKISNDTVVRADVKLASDVTGLVHAVLHSGNTTQLVSLEYVPSPAPSYQPWATRPSIVSLPNGNGAEAATLDIDSTGLMWVVRDVNNTVEVRYSAAPYSDWSAPAVVLDNINVDDIATISQVGTTGIGVMWSNQDIRLFGFSYHSDLDPPNVWSAAEYPGDANALNLGSGLADDHINLATTSDGTLYAAVKSGYNNPNVTTVGLFVRSPAGSWSDLIDIDSTSGSTRPIVAVNEVDSTVSIFFSTDSFGGSIAYREASTTDLVFGLSRTLMSSSVLTNTSSMKQNYVDSLVIMSSATQFASPTVQVESILLTK